MQFTEPPISSTRSISSCAASSISSVSASTKYEPANGSAVSAAPDSWARICWVRSAIRAAVSLGRASASSNPFVWSDCVPPHTAAKPWSATRTMLLCGCCAASVTPPVCVWKRIFSERSSFDAEALAHDARPHPAGGAELRHLLEDVVVPVEEEGEPRAELVDLEAGVDRGLHVGDRVGEREAHLLHRRAALLAHVVAGDRDRVPLRHALVAVGEQVGGEAHRRAGRVDEVAARDVLLQHVVLGRAGELLGRHALLLADQLVEEQQHRRRGVDRHRGRDLVERDPVEDAPHVVDRVDGHAGAPDLAHAERVVRVAAELGGEVERHRQPRRPVVDQVVEALVRLLRARVARVLAHRPLAAAVHVRMDPARERVLARLAEALLEVRLDVARAVDVLDLDARVGEAALVVRADDRRDARLLLGRRGHGPQEYGA